MEEKMNIYEKLSHIQNEMKVPKNLYNSFGKYHYRNAETILETAKPICMKYRTTLVIEDHIEVKDNGWTYVKSIATLHDWDSEEIVDNCAFAREPQEKKGMDSSQVTGATSSYCRKYCLNGLFCIDDVKDADADEDPKEKIFDFDTKGTITSDQIDRLYDVLNEIQVDKFNEHFKVSKVSEWSYNQAEAVLRKYSK